MLLFRTTGQFFLDFSISPGNPSEISSITYNRLPKFRVWLERCNLPHSNFSRKQFRGREMAAARSTPQEYWRPANPNVARLIELSAKREACWRCGVDYSPNAHFCHSCGSAREPEQLSSEQSQAKAPALLRFKSAGWRRKLSLAAVVLFVVGALCLAGAALMGTIFQADTMPAWEAIQAWRIEWLLAASASFLAGILLKKVI